MNNNVIVIAEGQDNTFAVTVKDWESLNNILNSDTKEAVTDYIDNGVINGEYSSYEEGFLDWFGDALNVFESPKGDTPDFRVLGQDSQTEPCNE